MTKRLPDWEVRFARWVESTQKAPFVWGKMDCGLRAGECVQVLTGVDVNQRFKGKYKTERGAHRLAKTLEKVGDKVFQNRIGINQTMRGDIVLAKVDGKETFVVDLADKYLTSTLTGAVAREKSECSPLIAWRIG